MKTIPYITALLILNTIYLKLQLIAMGGWQYWLWRIEEVDKAQITSYNQLLRNVASSGLAFSFLSLTFLIVIWRNPLCNKWLASGVTILWLVSLLLPFVVRIP